MNVIEELENEQLEKLTAKRSIPEFSSGDTVRVSVKVVEGSRERIQIYEGVCIGRSGGGVNASFTVRKISSGEGVERVFPLHSTAISAIEVVRRGDVRRAKLYYLRGRTGKAARIAEKTDGYAGKLTAREKAAAADSKARLKSRGAKAPAGGAEAATEASGKAAGGKAAGGKAETAPES